MTFGGMSVEDKAALLKALAEIEVVEAHLHGEARWFGATSGAGVGPGLLTSLFPFIVTTHDTASTYGTPIVVFDGTEDYDQAYTVKSFDPHGLFVLDVEQTGTYKLRFANSYWSGVAHTYANMAEAVAANHYHEEVVKAVAPRTDAIPVAVIAPRVRVGSIVWCQVKKESETAKWINFLVGVHPYATY